MKRDTPEEKAIDELVKDRDYLLGVIRTVCQELIAYQRDDALIFRESHKCRRLCEEAIRKVRG